MLVVMHHAILAYTTFFKYDDSILVGGIIPFMNMFNPILDSSGWLVFDIILGINDQYFMTLMFFISGFFLYSSYNRKGKKLFWGDRLKRLGLPFLIGIFTIIPLAYYPAHLQWGLNGNDHLSFLKFLLQFIKSGMKTPGPLWFLWVLLLFNLFGSLLFKLNISGNNKLKKIVNNPALLFISLLLISVLVHTPLVIVFNYKWVGVGPFVFQAARILHYMAYFLVGSLIGAVGVENSIFNSGRKWFNFWWVWFIVGFVVFLAFSTMPTPFMFPLSCICFVYAIFGLFLNFTREKNKVLDSLSRNSYGIYIFHYIFNSWIQYFLLRYNFSSILKGCIVFVATYLLSWILVSLVRRIPGFKTVL